MKRSLSILSFFFILISALNAFEAEREWRFVPGGIIIGAPAGWAGRIYFCCEDRHIYCLSEEGKLLWRKRFTRRLLPFISVAPDGTIFSGTEKASAMALNPRGGLIWRRTLDSEPGLPCIAKEGMVLFPDEGGKLNCLNPAGRLLWTLDLGSEISAPPVTDSKGNIYLGSADGYIYSFGPYGRERFSLWIGEQAGSISIYSDDSIAVCAKESSFYRISNTGTILFQKRFPQAPIKALIDGRGNSYILHNDSSLTLISARVPLSSNPAEPKNLVEEGTERVFSDIVLLAGNRLLGITSSGELITFSENAAQSAAYTFSSPMRFSPALVYSDDAVMLGGENWVVHSFTLPEAESFEGGSSPPPKPELPLEEGEARLETEPIWGQFRRGEGRRASADLEEEPLNRDWWKDKLDYLYYIDAINVPNGRERGKVLQEIGERVEHAELQAAVPYIREILAFLASDMPQGDINVNAEPRFNTADIRWKAVYLLGKIGAVKSADLLLPLLSREYEETVLAQIIRSLGECGGDSSGRILNAVFNTLERLDMNRPSERIGRAALETCSAIYSYHGSFLVPAGGKILSKIITGNFSRSLREEALSVLRNLHR